MSGMGCKISRTNILSNSSKCFSFSSEFSNAYRKDAQTDMDREWINICFGSVSILSVSALGAFEAAEKFAEPIGVQED